MWLPLGPMRRPTKSWGMLVAASLVGTFDGLACNTAGQSQWQQVGCANVHASAC